MELYPRPSHADWTYLEKYGVKASSGGGRSSARETIGSSIHCSGLDRFCAYMTFLQAALLLAPLPKNILGLRMALRLLRLCRPSVQYTCFHPPPSFLPRRPTRNSYPCSRILLERRWTPLRLFDVLTRKSRLGWAI